MNNYIKSNFLSKIFSYLTYNSYRTHSRIRKYGRADRHTNIQTNLFSSFTGQDDAALQCVQTSMRLISIT